MEEFLGPSNHKRRSPVRGVVQWRQGGRGFFRCECPHFLVQKIFSKSWCVCTNRGWVDLLQTRRRGQFFAILYGRPLWTARNKIIARIRGRNSATIAQRSILIRVGVAAPA